MRRQGLINRLWVWWVFRKRYYSWLRLQEAQVDVFLLRHSVADVFESFFIMRTKKPVFLVHHTLEVPELTGAGFDNLIKAFVEVVTGYVSLMFANGIVGVTNEIVQYQNSRLHGLHKVSFKYPNGIIYSDGLINDHRGKIPELLFVASSFESWHGLDLLLKSVCESKADFLLHLVGQIEDTLYALVKDDSRIVIHGKLTHDEITHLSETCWVGISSLGLDRKKMKEACTLKVREYLMLGLPVYAGYTDVFPEEFNYYKKGKADIQSILEFAELHRSSSRENIRAASRPFIDKTTLVQSLYHDLHKLWLQQYKVEV
jgi:glycosyltransferase involved in cell wall biosynthesis